MSIINQAGARLTFQNARTALENAGLNVRFAKLTQSYLRFERIILANTTVYQFPVLVNDNTFGVTNTEKRLQMQDSFVINQLNVLLAVPAALTDAAYRLFNYPAPAVFAANAAAQQVLYNAFLTITINNDILLPNWDVYKHFIVPETQAAAAPPPTDQIDGGQSGWYPVEPNVTFIGSKNNVVEITLPAAIAAVTVNSRIIVMMRGVLGQNTSVVS